MKKCINNVFVASILLIIIGVAGCKTKELTAEEQLRVNQMKEIIDSKKYTFVATVAIPVDISAAYSSFNLTSRYTLRVSNDSLVAELPYMGKTYVAVPGKGADGINFISRDFSYDVKVKNRNTLTVTFTTHDIQNVKYATLTVLTNGTASLNVLEYSRQPVTFEGYLEKK